MTEEKVQAAGKRMVLLEFSGRELTNNRVFDTTSEQEARQAGLYNEGAKFRPVPVVVGHGDVLPALDVALAEMKEGESSTLKLPPEKAFGERRKELVVVAPLQAFLSRKINPVPGLIVDLNGAPGRVQTVSGGRVRVDLNSDLAGKEVEYTLKVAKEIVGAVEKAQALAEKFFPLRGGKAETRLESGVLKVRLPKELAQQAAHIIVAFTKTAKEVVPEINAVEVVESFAENKVDAGSGMAAGEKAGDVEGWEQENKAKAAEAGGVEGGQEKITKAEKAAPAEAAKSWPASPEKRRQDEKLDVEVKRTDSTLIVRPRPKEKSKTAAPSKSTASTAIWHAKRKTKPS